MFEQPETKPKTESDLSNEAAADVEDTLGNMGIDVVLDQPNNTPMLNALLKKEYRKYQATASIMGDPVISFDRWRDSQEGVNLQNGFNALKKIWAAGKMSNNPSTQEIEYISPLSSEVVISEKGFEQWALSRETQENPQVRRVLDQLGLKLSDIFANVDVVPDKGSNIPGDANRKVIEKGSTAALIRINTVDVETGKRDI